MSLDTLPLTDVLDQTATTYETAAALPSVVERITAARMTAKPGSKPPPGVGDLLDDDEYQRAITATDDWAGNLPLIPRDGDHRPPANNETTQEQP